MTQERRYDIDWLRVIAIGLLVIYHIAIVFQPWAMQIGFVRSEEFLVGLWKPMSMLNVWRIPFLFFVSGMGVYFAIQKRTWWQLLQERSLRILLPFIFGMIAIVPLHLFIFQKFYQLPIGYVVHPGHLWFLGNIFCYVLLLAPLFFFLKGQRNSRLGKGVSAFISRPLGPLLLSVFFIAETLIIKPLAFEQYALTWHGFVLGFLAFFFGFIFVYSGEKFWQNVLRWRWLYIGLAATLFTIRLLAFETQGPLYLKALESNLWIYGIFGFGYKYLNRPSAWLHYFSQAAYPIYIIHMVFLHLSSWLILPLSLPVTLKLTLIIGLTFTGCFLTYELVIRRIEFLRPLFGLKIKWRQRKAEVQTELSR